MFQLEQISENGLDAAINSVGPYTPEYLDELLPSEAILDSAIAREGIIRSLTINVKGRTFDGIRKFDAGHPYTYDSVASAAAEEPRSVKRTNGSSPATFHVGLDFPDRIELLSGNYDFRKLGLFTMGVATRIAEVAGSDVMVVCADDESANLITEGDIDEVTTVYGSILNDRGIPAYQSSGNGGLVGITEQIQRTIKSDEDALFIVSDFQDGYDLETGEFNWEDSIQAMSAEFGDRFWPIRITSPTHKQMGLGLIEGLDLLTIQSINSAYADTAVAKDDRIDKVLGRLQKSKSVDMLRRRNNDHPVRKITQFILENI